MKESTGELGMVVVTLLAIAFIVFLFNSFKKPITDFISGKFTNITGQQVDTGNVK